MAANGVGSSDDADMASCDDDQVVTMVEVLQKQQEFEDDANAVLGASDDKNCTYSKGYVKRQAIYACLTCCPDAKIDPAKRAGVCLACSLNCHENHELVELYTKRNFRCDCGNPKFNNHPCQFTPNKSDLNYENKYNQNFSGLYCICHRPYPDPDATAEEEMIQCIVCEDWLHANHLEATVPYNDQYAEMVCKDCMEDNDFLHDYSDLIINVDDKIKIHHDPDLDVDITSITKEESSCNGDLKVENSTSDLKPVDAEEEAIKEAIEENNENVPNTKDKEDEPVTESKQKHDKDAEDTGVKETSANITNGEDEPKTDDENMETEKPNTDNDANPDNPDTQTVEKSSEAIEKESKADTDSNTSSIAVTDQATGASNESIVTEDKTDVESTPSIGDKSCQMTIAHSSSNSQVDEADSAKSTSVVDTSVSVINEMGMNTEQIEVNEAGTSKDGQEAEEGESKDGQEAEVGESKDGQEAEEGESKDNKRKADQEGSEDDVAVKKPKLDSNPCTRPRGVKRVYQGSTFWPSTLRQKLCACNECTAMYKDLAVLFLIDFEDTVSAYEALGKDNEGGPSSQYEQGLEALLSLDRIQQVNALTEYNKMRDKLLDFLKSFKERKEIVKEEDIKAFFAGMKPKREPDGVYFCR